MIDLSIVIVSFNTRELTIKCLESIFQQKWKLKYEVWVVDNASTDDSVATIKKLFPQVKLIINDKNAGFAAANNLALAKAQGKYLLLLNSDTEVLKDSLDDLLNFMEKKNFAIGSCKLVNKDDSFQPNTGDLPSFWPLFFWISGADDILLGLREQLPSYHRKFKSFYNREREVGWVSGSVMMISREVLEKIGFLDDAIFMYSEDTEYCMRAKKAGFKIGWTNQATIKHLGGGSSKSPAFKQWVGEFRGLRYIYRKYYGFMPEQVLRLIINLFILLRMATFFIIGKIQISKTYAKVLINI